MSALEIPDALFRFASLTTLICKKQARPRRKTQWERKREELRLQTGRIFKQHQCFQVAENFQCFQVAEEREPVVPVRVGWDTHMQIEQQARVFLLQKVCFPLCWRIVRSTLTSGGVVVCLCAVTSLVSHSNKWLLCHSRPPPENGCDAAPRPGSLPESNCAAGTVPHHHPPHRPQHQARHTGHCRGCHRRNRVEGLCLGVMEVDRRI